MTMQFRLRQCEYWPTLLPCIFAAALIGGLWSATLYQLGSARDSHLAGAAREAENFASLLTLRTERAIDVVDQTVEFMKYAYDELGASLDLDALASGGVIAADMFKPGSAKLAPGKPVPGAGAWTIPMARRLNLPDSSFNGALVAAIDPLVFSRIYDQVDLGRQGTISLVGFDGVIRARRSAFNDAIGTNVSDTPIFKSMALKSYGALRAVSAIDGIDRLWAYRQLEDQSLYVVVGVGIDDSLQSFDQMRRHVLALAALSTLLIVIFSALLIVMIRRLCLGREQAIAESRNKTALLSSLSHELRTPLNGILGYAELLRDELVDAEKRSFAQYIHASGTHLLDLVNSLLQISKIEAGEVSVELKNENLAALLDAAIHAHASSAAAKGLTLALTMAPDLPLELACDRMRVMQVLNNLLHNAIKFTGSGRVELAASASAQQVRFSVTDTGPGIAADLRTAIFGSFFQADRHAMEGSGLGLAIAKQLVELMSGTLGVESTPGHGATFFFTLPLGAAR
jgi:two-component system sensor histidine kinase BarA